MKKKSTEQVEVAVIEVKHGQARFALLGESPIIMNRMSEKAKHELLFPLGRKTAADKAQNLKHNPLEEFRASPHRIADEGAATLLAMPSTAFKKAIGVAALDMPGGAKKAQIGRLTYIAEEYVPIFGIPCLKMDVVRSADMSHTPDIRTRAAVKQWAALVSISYIQPVLNDKTVMNLMAGAGMMVGVGDWRPEKGAGSFGRFRLVNADDPDFLDLVNNAGRKAQLQAMKTPEAYDTETEELLVWFNIEVDKRGKKGMLVEKGGDG